MAYYVRVLEGEPASLHRDRCRYRHTDDTSSWYGPFTTPEEAREHGGGALEEGCSCLVRRTDYLRDDG